MVSLAPADIKMVYESIIGFEGFLPPLSSEQLIFVMVGDAELCLKEARN